MTATRTSVFAKLFRRAPKTVRNLRPVVRTRLGLTALEAREVPAYLSAGALVIDGTAGPDTVYVTQTVPTSMWEVSKVQVVENGRTQVFSASSVRTGVVRFRGNGGNDIFQNAAYLYVDADGGTGMDVLSGGPTDDTLVGGSGNDHDALYGNGGVDRIWGGGGADEIRGGDGNDVLAGDGDNDTIRGGPGNDAIYGGDGHDTLYGDNNAGPAGGVGNDTMAGGAGNDTMAGEGGNDYMQGESGADSLYGNDGHDTMSGDYSGVSWGGEAGDYLSGGAGNDTMAGQGGADYLYGGVGDDSVSGDGQDDWLYGEAGDDQLSGGEGADGLVGGDGQDALSGGAGNDFLAGGGGVDVLAGGTGVNTLSAGYGSVVLALASDSILSSGGAPPSSLRFMAAELVSNQNAATQEASEQSVKDFVASNYERILSGDMQLPELTGTLTGIYSRATISVLAPVLKELGADGISYDVGYNQGEYYGTVVTDVIDIIKDQDAQTAENILETLAGIVVTVYAPALPLGLTIAHFGATGWEAIKSCAGWVGEGLVDGVEAVGAWVGGAWDTATDAVGDAWDWVTGWI